jgi:hypothetical protein
MDKQLVDNYYLDIKTIIGSALIGVVSFQLLGPVVWEYLQTNLGIPFKIAFRIFIFCYFLLIAAGFLNRAMVSGEYVDTNSIKMVNNVSGVLSINSGQMNKITQKLLGPNLRNLQEWGVVMFLFLLLTMLSHRQV